MMRDERWPAGRPARAILAIALGTAATATPFPAFADGISAPQASPGARGLVWHQVPPPPPVAQPATIPPPPPPPPIYDAGPARPVAPRAEPPHPKYAARWYPEGWAPPSMKTAPKGAYAKFTLTIAVAVDGRPTSCRHNGTARLTKAVASEFCDILATRARFVPAKNKAGVAVPGLWSDEIACGFDPYPRIACRPTGVVSSGLLDSPNR